MNRKQKRQLSKYKTNKSIVFNNLSKIAIDSLTAKTDKSRPRIGDKCRINIDKITNRKEWDRLNPKYKKFVLDNASTIFTAREDKFKPKEDGFVSIVAFEEDITEPKWLWNVDDLIKVE
ncbi:MAG: hypothetical protein U0M12_08445 [Acutalibacteraceae bacterium]|nr:hypothetical protein [Acutalibacteraceae bacterium]